MNAKQHAEHGATLPEQIQAGRWKDSKMVARYTRNQEAGRGAVASFFECGSSRSKAGDAGCGV